MDFLGHDLTYYMKTNKRLNLKCVMRITYFMLKILETIHNRKVVHRDLKPENIVLINKKRNIFSYPIRYIDNLIYKQQYINIVIHILLLVILLFICNYIFTKLKIFIKFGANSIYKVRRRRL